MKLQKTIDALGLGNALLDVTLYVEDSFLKKLNLKKGTMTLIDEKTYRSIYQEIANMPSKKSSGGSASNTIKGLSTLGAKSAFMGMIGTDSHAKAYENALKKARVNAVLHKSKTPSGTAITFITKDKERTFATYLGASLDFNEKYVDEKLIKQAKILHIEGFFLEPPQHKASALKAMTLAKKYGTKISIDLSDPSLIERNKESFKEIVKEFADIIFVNEYEAKAFSGLDAKKSLHHISTYCEYSIVKLGSKGSIIKHQDKVYTVKAHKVKVINTNGAGDAYAAGILFGIARNLPMDIAGQIASFLSAKVVGCEDATISENVVKDVKKIIKG